MDTLTPEERLERLAYERDEASAYLWGALQLLETHGIPVNQEALNAVGDIREENERLKKVAVSALEALESASRQLTEDHRGVLNGKRWGESVINSLREALHH